MRRDVAWVATSAQRLRSATFLDGRETFWSGTARVESIDPVPGLPAPSVGMILHPGFCGSTLLARLLDRPGTSLVLKEPQALTDIASQTPTLDADRRDAALWWTLERIARVVPAGEGLVIKPSNWINALAPALIGSGLVGRAVVVTMAPRAFLRAAFRGGRDRLAHCLRLADLLGQQRTGGSALIAGAIAEASDPLDRAALLVALLQRWQTELLLQAEALLPPGHAARIDQAELAADPAAMAARAAAALGLALGPQHIGHGFDPTLHAKDTAQPYTAQAEDETNRLIEQHHAQRFDRALTWVAQAAE